jgi:hypothetical protein
MSWLPALWLSYIFRGLLSFSPFRPRFNVIQN